ncbi:hypothetical protein Acr_07g0014550 [Actinidia rufa]|uniref:Pectinesterase inhibitor domain-containing protein n=1 Tax=Actinidia rufa TaxID=165716 RepID=A0A7J0EZ70_9ERIC|nr:hypothetical protein Acr_07g0014550 [Actinidia rufa]
MGSSSWFMLFLFSIASLHFHQPIVTVRGDTDLIEKTCKSTKHYGLCVSSLKSNTSSLKSDTKGLAVIMVGVGIANATATASFLSSQALFDNRVKKGGLGLLIRGAPNPVFGLPISGRTNSPIGLLIPPFCRIVNPMGPQLLSATANDPLMRKVLKDCADKYSYAGNIELLTL